MFALLHNRGAAFTRWLSLLLVVFILYGTTVEAAHRHGRTLLSTSSAAAHFDQEQTQNRSTSQTGCNDCLICQLHQNFSTTAITLRLKHDPQTQAPRRVTTVTPEGLRSQIIRPQAGRAPPETN
jgi:hypothetical protein